VKTESTNKIVTVWSLIDLFRINPTFQRYYFPTILSKHRLSVTYNHQIKWNREKANLPIWLVNHL